MVPSSSLIRWAIALVLAASFGTQSARGCGEDVDHLHGPSVKKTRMARQPAGGSDSITPLTWGDFNVIHTTDIHGWYQGHAGSSAPEPNYSGDWGDFASFVSHMRAQARSKGVDLVIVDTGDLHDGAGLSDGFPVGEVDGHVSNGFHSRVEYDLLTIGNHELYKYGVAFDTYKYFVPAQRGRYVSSNVNISLFDQDLDHNVSHVIGERYVKFTTEQGRKVTGLGVLFNFKGQDGGISIQDPKDLVNETWFKEAIQEAADVFLIAGHMPVSRDQFPVVIKAIRALHPSTPVLVLGGHSHIRDCIQYDSSSVGLESGRYLETIGWLAANVSFASEGPRAFTFSRSYIDGNRRNYAFHTQTSPSTFDTTDGLNITASMSALAAAWNLTDVFGYAPQSYYLDRYPLSSSDSLLHLFSTRVLPELVGPAYPPRKNSTKIILANSGAQRFDVFRGNFTRNDQFIVSPFRDEFLYLEDVEWSVARRLEGELNKLGWAATQTFSIDDDDDEAQRAAYEQGEIDTIFNAWRARQARDGAVSSYSNGRREPHQPLVFESASPSTFLSSYQPPDDETEVEYDHDYDYGYVTSDSCPNSQSNGVRGDDTAHRPIPYHATPAYVSTGPLDNSTTLRGEDRVDVVFVDFIAKNVVEIVKRLRRQQQRDEQQQQQQQQQQQSQQGEEEEEEEEMEEEPLTVRPWGDVATDRLYELFADKEWQVWPSSPSPSSSSSSSSE